MRKYTLLGLGTLLSMAMIVIPAWAAPTWSGTSTFTFSGSSTTVDWAVYQLGDTGPGYISATEYTYAYTINGWSGENGWLQYSVNLTASDVTGAGTSITGGAQTLMPTPPGAASGITQIKGSYPAGSIGVGNTSTVFWTSGYSPVTASGGSSLSIGGQTATMSGALAMAPSAPGVPEPETWGLLIMLSAFTMWWMRRRQDENVAEEDFTA